MKKVVLSLFALSLVACTPHKNQLQGHLNPQANDAGIFGGKTVDQNDQSFNGVVGIVFIDEDSGQPAGLCSGTLITNNIVLTAAHCVDVKYRIAISFEKNILTPKAIASLIPATATVYHKNYNSNAKETYDIGLIKFNAPLPAGVKPVTLAGSSQGLHSGMKIIAAGYGVDSAFRNKGSGILRSNVLEVDDMNFSRFEFSVSQYFNGVCSGDSGGPAFMRTKSGLAQVGVVSRGFNLVLVKCIVETYFTRVDQFQDWIQTEAAKL